MSTVSGVWTSSHRKVSGLPAMDDHYPSGRLIFYLFKLMSFVMKMFVENAFRRVSSESVVQSHE